MLKFVGDEVFAVFGAPLPVPDHPQVALDCAIEIQVCAPACTALADIEYPARAVRDRHEQRRDVVAVRSAAGAAAASTTVVGDNR